MIAAMIEWLRCSTRIHKILYSNLSIVIHGMTLDKPLTATLSRMTHSYRTNALSVSTLDGRSADTGVRKKEKDGRNWLQVDPNNNRSRSQRVISLREVIIIIIIVNDLSHVGTLGTLTSGSTFTGRCMPNHTFSHGDSR